ncbi:peptidyl-prolyl cis-trans isomerase FKBP53-like [Phragmites australis]|uniref:peptidyl-prolyl cis-trans isomerase FKBP53-like n=1 Tax=Phragmites australis TaxID=29695 RepID=UPI002D768668|nr:peptidyl-prolyl cis-trans isomerase FKBP53-like [Phragmites australis]
MSSFWGVEVKPGKPYTLTHSDCRGRLRLTQATLGSEVGKGEKGADRKKCVLQCSVKNRDPVFLCVLVPEQSETCHLELEFEEEHVTFSVIGPRSVHLAGYYIVDDYGEDISDSDARSDSLQGSDDDGLLETDDDDNMVMIDQMLTDSEDDDSDYDSESDDEEMAYNQRRGKSSVVIEEIQEDDKVVGVEAKKGSNKKQSSENGDKSQLQLVVRTPPAESLESEDEDGFPVSFSESKKSGESVSKKNRNLNKGTSNEDRKRKSGVISDRPDSSGEVKVENDGASKKKKKVKDKSTVVDNGKVNNEEKEIKQQDSPADPIVAKQKKKKNKNRGASEVDNDQQSAKENHIHKDGEEVTAQEANKKKNKKKKTQEANKRENQAPTRLKESESKKEPLQTRTFGNGMIIEEVAMGKPDGKKATSGKKVSVRYIGKLMNGTIFDSNVSGRPFEFRLGVGQVIKGWDIGVSGMRFGDKRRLTIPPSMGYGSERVGKIPQNSTLIFDVELVNVR